MLDKAVEFGILANLELFFQAKMTPLVLLSSLCIIHVFFFSSNMKPILCILVQVNISCSEHHIGNITTDRIV